MSESSRGRVRVEPGPKRVRVYVAGHCVADTTHPMYVWESPAYPTYYFPVSDVDAGALVATETRSHSLSRGDARHFTVKVNDVERVDAALQYAESPIDELRELIRFDWGAMDAWFEEDEEVYTHARSPYARVDILPSSRNIRIELDGVVLAESHRVHALFETGLPTRWYLPKTDVHLDLLVATETESRCPYKGQAEYWSARIGERLERDIVWSYRTPLPESERVAGLMCFYNERVDLFIDGERQERPKTKFS
jgi:uncharacterized protein (DUF427 family)